MYPEVGKLYFATNTKTNESFNLGCIKKNENSETLFLFSKNEKNEWLSTRDYVFVEIPHIPIDDDFFNRVVKTGCSCNIIIRNS
jgi:hypothetical protein